MAERSVPVSGCRIGPGPFDYEVLRGNMKYLCLVYLEEQKLHAVPDRECATCGAGLRHLSLIHI